MANELDDVERFTEADPTTTTVTVFTRHNPDCPKKQNRYWKRCNCRKSLYIYENGKVSFISAKTRSWEQAERLAQQERDKRDPVKIRLKEIEVDPKTVVVAQAMQAGAVGVPKTAADLQAATWHYQVKIEMAGQQMSMKLATTIEDGGGTWTATDTMDTPQGSVTDTAMIDKSSLIVRKRSVKQGPVAIDVDFAGDKAAGQFSMNGQTRPIAVDLGGPLFGDAAGGDQAIACLPLAEGYSTTFRNFDLQSQKVQLMQLKVAGVEKVTVPAGTFDAYRLEITPSDGADKKTLWVDKDSRKVVKAAAVVASMGGAVVTEELVQ